MPVRHNGIILGNHPIEPDTSTGLIQSSGRVCFVNFYKRMMNNAIVIRLKIKPLHITISLQARRDYKMPIDIV